MLRYNKQIMNSRKRKYSDSSEDEFNINEYNISDLESLINMIEDFMIKPCSKKTKRQLPKKFNKLTNILTLNI